MLFLIISYEGVAFNTIIRNETIVQVKGTREGYIKNVVINGITGENDEEINIYYDKELEEIDQLNVTYFTSNDKKHKLGNAQLVYTSANADMFYHSYKRCYFSLPQHVTYTYSYRIINKELMTLGSAFEFQSKDNLSSSTIFHVPDSIQLLYDNKLDSTIKLDSSFVNSNWIYHFKKSSPSKNRVRIILLPRNQINPWVYFNNWYLDLIKERIQTNAELQQLSDSIANIKDTSTSITQRIFDYVRLHINYINIENGIGAFKPRDPTDIYRKQEGDCKDMANLLAILLRCQGIKANLMLIQTSEDGYQMDFPGIVSANHVVCAIRKFDDWMYIDPTFSCGTGLNTPNYLQNKSAFVIDDAGGNLLFIKPVSFDVNYISVTQNLKQSSFGYGGKVKLKLSGDAAEIFHCQKYYSNFETGNSDMELINKWFHAEGIDSVEIQYKQGIYEIQFQILYSNKLIQNLGNYQVMDFSKLLPFNEIFLDLNNTYQFNCKLKGQTLIDLYEPKTKKTIKCDLNENGVSDIIEMKSLNSTLELIGVREISKMPQLTKKQFVKNYEQQLQKAYSCINK